MSNTPKIVKFKSLSDIAVRFRSDLKDLDFVLLYAYNGTGKTRLSMEFKGRIRQTRYALFQCLHRRFIPLG